MTKNMLPALRCVTQLPLTELFDGDGPLPHRRDRDVSADEIREFLRSGPVRFVVADLAGKPEFVPISRSFEFWKSEALPHVADPHERVRREQFPGEYLYWASLWIAPGGPDYVLLEKCH